MNRPVTITEWYVIHDDMAVGVGTPSSGLWPPHQVGSTNRRTDTRETESARVREGVTSTHAGLGSASAGAAWGWVQHVSARDSARPSRTELPMSPSLMRSMAAAATACGRPERDVWAEAAREWLLRHAGEGPEPPQPGAPARQPRPSPSTRQGCWAAIDILLNDLRDTHQVALAPADLLDRESAA
jgi:hypothetical protein